MSILALEIFFLTLLGLAGLAIFTCIGFVLTGLFRGQKEQALYHKTPCTVARGLVRTGKRFLKPEPCFARRLSR